MSAVVLCSATGAPGVTTSAVALSWVWQVALPGRRALMVDADPSGSGLLATMLLNQTTPATGVLALAADSRRSGVGQWVGACVALPGQRWVLPGVADPVQAAVLGPVWEAFADVVVEADLDGIDLVVDAGRLGHRWEPTVVLAEADVVLLVSDASASSCVATAAAVRALRTVRAPRLGPVVLLVGAQRPYSASEVAAAVGVDVLSLPDDRRAGQDLVGGAWGPRVDRSALLRSARALVEQLGSLVPGGARP